MSNKVAMTLCLRELFLMYDCRDDLLEALQPSDLQEIQYVVTGALQLVTGMVCRHAYHLLHGFL